MKVAPMQSRFMPDEAGEDAEAEADGTDDTGDTGVPSDCGSFTDQASCEAQNSETLSCLWRPAWRTSRSGDSCEIEETGVCFGIEIGDTAAGCGSLAGCEDGPYANPFYVEEDGGTVLLVDFCGGSPPAEYQPCSTGELAADDPPECACACALAP